MKTESSRRKSILSIHDKCHGERFNPHLVVNVPNIKQQHGTKDRGVFAIAYEYHAALGDDVSIIVFDQKMRQHLERCFRQRKLSSFPHSIGYKPKQMHFPFHEIEVFCTCQTPVTWDNMVCCDSCGEWYHLRCINLRSMLNSVEQWFCSACNLLQFLFLSLFDSINVYDCQ